MRVPTWLILGTSFLLVIALAIAVGTGAMPLGVRGEWEWLRAKGTPPFDGMALALLGVAAYALFVGLAYRGLAVRPSVRLEGSLLAALLAASIGMQILIPMAAAPGYDLSKWAAVNFLPGSAGYFKIARQQAMRDPWKFLADYPQWIRSQDSLHIGTHPPGLIAAQCLLLGVMEKSPGITRFLVEHMPETVELGFRVFADKEREPLSREDRAALYATALVTLIACAGTVVPLYLLSRTSLPAHAAWAAAACWPLVPSANLFQPVADTAYPFLSTSAIALAAWGARGRGGAATARRLSWVLAVASGMTMAAGMFFTLAFLPVGLIVALVVSGTVAIPRAQRALVIVTIGLGFSALMLCGWLVIGANPLVVAAWNLHHHARFYDEYPRTYGLWLFVNPLELAIALGIPAVLWCAFGLFTPRRVPLFVWSTIAVLALTNLTGRNMGEVARLWMLYFPPVLGGTGLGLARVGTSAAPLAVTVALLGVQTLALQSFIQVVYPV